MVDDTLDPKREGPKRPSRFTRWRGSRPFWGGLLIILAGLEIFATERAPLHVMVHVGLQGVAGHAIPLVLVLLGVLLWVNPALRIPQNKRRVRRPAAPSSSGPAAGPPA